MDCVIYPRAKAVPAGQQVTNALLASNWKPETGGKFSEPGNSETLDQDLPAVRLYPPDSSQWFVELLTVPASENEYGRQFTRIQVLATTDKTTIWHFGLPSFRFLALTQWKPFKSEFGICYARPSMMALANLLEHPSIGTATMNIPIAGRTIKRSNKDIGRVVALAYLSGVDELEGWSQEWQQALNEIFPESYADLISKIGSGLECLLQSEEDREEATHTCNSGLLASTPITPNQFKIIIQRLQQDVIEELT